MLQEWAAVLVGAFERIWSDVISVLPNIIVAIALLIIGWIVGAGLARLVAQLIDALKVDQALRSAGIEKAITQAGYRLHAGGFLGAIVKWFIIAVFFVAALEVVGLTQVTAFLSQIVFFYLPQVIVAVFILLIAAVVAEFVHNLAVGAAKAAEIGSPYFVGSVARWAIWVFAILAALDQLAVAQAFVQTLFTGIVIAVALALGLSFGLGSQQTVGRYVEGLSDKFQKRS